MTKNEQNFTQIKYAHRTFQFYHYNYDEIFHHNSPIENIFITADNVKDINIIIAHIAVQFHMAGLWDWIRMDTDDMINEDYHSKYSSFEENQYYHYLMQDIKPHHRLIYGQYIDRISPLIDFRKSALLVIKPITFSEIFNQVHVKDGFTYWLESKRHSNIKHSEKLIKSLIKQKELE